MKELIIKTRTQEFRFSLEDLAFIASESVITVVEFRKDLPYESTYRKNNWITKKFCDKGDHVIYLTTNSINLKDQILREEFIKKFEDSEGINFCPLFEETETFKKYLERVRSDKEYLRIILNFSEILELSLNGKSLL